MPLVTSATGVYLWTYTSTEIGNTTVQNYLTANGILTDYLPSATNTLAELNVLYNSIVSSTNSLQTDTLDKARLVCIKFFGANGTVGFPSATTILGGTNNGSGNIYPTTVVYSNPYLVATGHTYDTGQVLVYKMDSVLTTIAGVTYTNSVLIIFSVIAWATVVVAPPPVTLEIKQNQDNTYIAQDPTILTKYAQSVNKIRAKFGAGLTRIGVVEPTSTGGFLLYEEVASAPSGNVYVYDNNRHLVIVVDAALISQYQA